MGPATQDPGSAVPMIGAIGAILGAYLLLYSHARVLVLIPLGSFTQLIRVRAVFVLGFWFVLQLFSSAAQTAGTGGVACWAHVGGFVAGAALIIVFRKPGFPLLAADRRQGPGAALRPLGIGGAPTRFADIDRALPLFGAIKAAAVTTVEPGSPAWRNGLQQGDVVVAVNRRPVPDISELEDAIKKAPPRSRASSSRPKASPATPEAFGARKATAGANRSCPVCRNDEKGGRQTQPLFHPPSQMC